MRADSEKFSTAQHWKNNVPETRESALENGGSELIHSGTALFSVYCLYNFNTGLFGLGQYA